MNKEDALLLQNCSPLEKIICDIKCIAAHGGTSWEGVIANDSWNIKNYFKEHGFAVTSHKISCLIVTISWNG